MTFEEHDLRYAPDPREEFAERELLAERADVELSDLRPGVATLLAPPTPNGRREAPDSPAGYRTEAA